MTLLFVGETAADTHFVELDNQARGVVVEEGEGPGTWQDAMADAAFVQDQESFLELAADADSETFDRHD